MSKVKIIVVGTRWEDREALIRETMKRTGLPRTSFIDVGVDVQKMTDVRHLEYIDSGAKKGDPDHLFNKYLRVTQRLLIGRHKPFKAGNSK